MLEPIVLLAASLLGMGEGKVELSLSSALKQIDSSLAEYLKNVGSQEIPEPCRAIIEDERVSGFEVTVGSETWAFDLDGYVLKNWDKATYFSSGDPGLTSLNSLMSMDGFDPSSCLCQIPSLVAQYGASSFGNWNVVSFDSGTDDCAQIASLDLIYTYRFSGFGNPSIYSNNDDLYYALQTEQNHQPGLGILLSDYLPGLNAVLKPSVHAMSGSYNATKPVVCAYAPDSGYLGHFAMKIGEAETAAFWNLKTQWDIVVSNDRNYLGIEPCAIDQTAESCFFGIQANRRQATFILFGC